MNLKCSISIGSVTYANKAQRILALATIYSEIIKNNQAKDGKGCTYGLALPCDREKEAFELLKNSGVKFKVISDGKSDKAI